MRTRATTIEGRPIIGSIGCAIGRHGDRCQWIGAGGDLRAWPMTSPLAPGQDLWCSCPCHELAPRLFR